MRYITLIFSLFLAVLAFASGTDVVVVKVNGKEARDLTLGLYQKPGGYKPAPKTSYKRTNIKTVEVTAPTEGLDSPTDSLTIKLTGYAGAVPYFKAQQNVTPGGTASFQAMEPAMQDFTPSGKQQTLLGRFEVEVVPMKRANQKGTYKGVISIEN